MSEAEQYYEDVIQEPYLGANNNEHFEAEDSAEVDDYRNTFHDALKQAQTFEEPDSPVGLA